MDKRRKLKVYLARRFVAGIRVLQTAIHGVDQVIQSSLSVVLRIALGTEEREALGIALYDDTFDPENDLDGLYPWEETWFARRLPAPPARVLIGAAGCGREAIVLERLGYSVIALEPSERAATQCVLALGNASIVLQASYGDLVAAVLTDSRSNLSLTHRDRFDAVLLGWGSFGHVLREEDRFRLLQACHALCPTGPILLSVFRPAAPPTSRPEAETPIAFLPWGGFLAAPTAEELADHCKGLGRELIAALDNSSPYFTLVPTVTATYGPANLDPPALGH